MNGGPQDGAPAAPDPVSALREAALAMHTLFTEYVAAGFTEYQACVILGVMVAQQGKGQ